MRTLDTTVPSHNPGPDPLLERTQARYPLFETTLRSSGLDMQGTRTIETTSVTQFPLLEAMLHIKGLDLKPTYTTADAALLFEVSVRTVQNHMADHTMPSRKLMGRARFLPIDLETFLENSLSTARSTSRSDV